MCYLAVYHPETKVWQKADEKTLDDNHLYAIAHTDLNTTEEIAPVVCPESGEEISFYILCKAPEPACLSCQEIGQKFHHILGKGNQ